MPPAEHRRAVQAKVEKRKEAASLTPAAGDSRTTSITMWAAVAGLVVLHLALANGAAWNKCATFDEASHIANGYSIWKTGDYRMFPVALAQQRWMTLPLYLANVPAPTTDQPIWFRSDNWGWGRQLLYEMGNDGASILRQVRFMTSLLSGVMAVMVFCIARRLFGAAGGFVAMLLYVLNPTVLANAALATVDMSASLAILAAMMTLWSVLQEFTPRRLALSSIVWGLAFCAKFSTLLLIPMGCVLVAVRVFDGRPWPVQLKVPAVLESRLLKALYGLLVAGAHGVGVWLVIWTLFGFQFPTFREFPNDPKLIYTGSFEDVAKQAPTYTGLLNFSRKYHLFPEAYLYAFADTVRTTVGRSSYLDNWFGIYGFRSYFPLAFLYKTPLAVFGLMLVALAAHTARRMHQMRVERRRAMPLLWEGIYVVLPLVVIIGVYGASAIFSGMNIGIRHILPMFAPLFILCGLAGEWLAAGVRRFGVPPVPSDTGNSAKSESRDVGPAPPAGWPSCPDALLRGMFGSVVVLVVLLVGETALSFPNYLAYFNVASGGIENGHKHLVDSSLDWGQELPALKEWLEQEGMIGGSTAPRIYLSYFGTTPPSSVGFKMYGPTEPGLMLLPGYFDRAQIEPRARQPFELSLSEGVYCISATMLQTTYLSPCGGPWIESYEKQWRVLSAEIARFEKLRGEPAWEEEIKKNGRYWLNVVADFERHRLGRLCAYLRSREPVHIVNGAILVYRLSTGDLEMALMMELAHAPRPDPKEFGEPMEY